MKSMASWLARGAAVACVLATSSAAWSAPPKTAAAPMDWPHWRGPEQNGISREKNLPAKWDPSGENLIWAKEELSTRSTPIVMNGKLYFLQNDRPASPEEGEKVVCADAATGEVLWQNRFNVFLSDVPDTRVGWSSVVGDPETGNVYALGVCGQFQAMDGKTGKTLWQHSMSEEYGLLSTYGGRTNFPIIHDNLVIISAVIIGWGEMSQPAHRFVAFDKRTGVPVWFNGTRLRPEDTTYSTPVTGVIHGQAVMVFGSGDGGVYAFQPRTGKPVWNYLISTRGINTTPVIVGDKVYAGHGEENVDNNAMGSFVSLDGTKTGDLMKGGVNWRINELGIGRAAPLVIDDRVYVIDDTASLLVVDVKSGKLVGKKQKLGTVGWGSPVYADGKIYCVERNGRCYIYEPSKDGVKKLHQLRLDGEEINTSPIVSHGRIYIATNHHMYCIGLEGAKPEADPIPVAPEETPASEDQKPAQVQVVPVEALLAPGQSQQYEVRLFNAAGQFLGTADDLKAKVEFSVSGVGEIGGDGKYEAPAKTGQAAVSVTAKVGELSGQARARIVPPLPWKYDFSDGQIPVTWVGIRYRHVAIDYDLFEKLKKANPLSADLYVYTTTTFVNANLTKAKYQDVGPVQRWTELLRFAEMNGKVTNLDEAKSTFEPALKLLVEEKVLAKYAFGTEGGLFIAVEQGPRKVEGNGVMCKITTIPKGTRSQGWMGPIDFSDYTFQADVLGTSVPSAAENPALKMPDIGVIAQRYRFELMGASQEVKLYSWVAHEIKFKKAPFEWQPDVWYTMKLQASTEKKDGKEIAVLRGKVWKRDEKEPSAWTIEWTDVPANTHGSPGLVGNAKDSEIFFDNIQVTPNTASTTAGK